MALAGIHAFALDLGFISRTGSTDHGGREHHGGGGGQSNARHLSAVHLRSLLEVITIDLPFLDEPSSRDGSLPAAQRQTPPPGHRSSPGLTTYGSAHPLYASQRHPLRICPGCRCTSRPY